MPTKQKTYSRADNARRAAKSAGLREFAVYKTADGRYKIRAAAAKPTKPAKAPKAAKPRKPRQLVDESTRDSRKLAKLKGAKPQGKRAAVLAAAQAGKLPPPPDFSAHTHGRYREKLASIVRLAKAGDVKGLKSFEIIPYSSSPKAMVKYRDLVIIALKARRAAA